MTQEEKQLLLKDLCARLPYNVKVAIDFKSYLDLLPDDDIDSEYPYKKNLNTILRCSNKSIYDISQEPHILYSYICSERFGMLRGYENDEYGVPVELIKPYLRPLSNMTDEERLELSRLSDDKFKFYLYTRKPEIICYEKYNYLGGLKILDWLNAHHFDFHNLIKRGLAIDCTNLNIY